MVFSGKHVLFIWLLFSMPTETLPKASPSSMALPLSCSSLPPLSCCSLPSWLGGRGRLRKMRGMISMTKTSATDITRLRGGGSFSDEERQEYEDEKMFQAMDPGPLRLDALSRIPGCDDVLPHPDVTGWSPEEYAARGIDMTGDVGQVLEEAGALDLKKMIDSVQHLTEEEELDVTQRDKERALAAMEQGSDECEGDAMNSSDEREMKEEAELTGVCPMCPPEVRRQHRHVSKMAAQQNEGGTGSEAVSNGGSSARLTAATRGDKVDPSMKHVDDMTFEDWEQLTDEQHMSRMKIAREAFEKKEASPFYDVDYVYGGKGGDDDDVERELRFARSFLGMHKVAPAADSLLEEYDSVAPQGVNKSLIDAALDGDAQQCGYWVRRGADVNFIDGTTGYSVLMYAAMYGQERAVQALLEIGADTLYREETEGRTAMHLAACKGHCGVVKILARLCPVDARSSRRGRTALHDAAGNGQTHTVATLLSLGADVRAVYHGLPEGQDAENEGDDGDNARGAQGNGQEGMFQGVFTKNHRGRHNFEDANNNQGGDEEEDYETALASVARAPCISNGHATALHDAAEGGYTMTCLQLLAAGASLHATDADGLTPGERAARRGFVGDPQCPMHSKGGLLETLDKWEEGVIGPSDVASPPNASECGPVGVKGRVHLDAGRLAIGEGGDIAGYESPWNYNGEPPRTMVDREWKDYLAQGEELLERDLLAYRSRLEGVRRKGFWNPGHCINYASGHEKSGRDVIEECMTLLALPKRSRLTKQEREDRVFRRYMMGYLPEQQAERQEYEKAVEELEGKGEARGFFNTMMSELALTG